MKQQELSEAEAFFREHGGYGVKQGDTTERAQARAARELAVAEARLKAGPYTMSIAEDPVPYDGDVSWDGPVWIVQLLRIDGRSEFGEAEILGSIAGVAAEWDSPELRVIMAELASEYLPSLVEDIQVVSSWNGAIRDDQGRISVTDANGKRGWATLTVVWEDQD